jgi:hypothetical protein
MAVHRKRAAVRKPRAPRSQVSRVALLSALQGGGGGDQDLRAAAQVIADGAKALAGAWSKQIPPRIKVSVDGNTATISCDAPPAYPNELAGVRHPVFGRHTERWVTNAYRPFLSTAADARADAAMAKYAQKIDKLCRAAGYR